MSLATAELPNDPAELRAFALACQGELKAAQTAVQLKALEIEKLKFQIAKLRRMQFGRSSERISRQIEQLEFRLEELETGGPKTSPALKPRIGRDRSANAPGPSASRCPIICRDRMSCISLRTMARVPAPPAAREWPGSART